MESSTTKQGIERRLDFVGVGSARCGTTWVAKCLDEHPEIFVAKKKELHFFNNDRRWKRHGTGWLDDHFDYSFPGKIGEFTPRYLISADAMKRIRESFPGTRILVLLRDPLRRALSQFQYFRYNRYKEPSNDFRKALNGPAKEDYLSKSLYAGQIEMLLSLFPRDQVFIGIYEEFTDQPVESFQGLFEFLGVEKSFVPPSSRRRVNASGSKSGAPRAFLAWLNRLILNSPSRVIQNNRVKKLMRGIIEHDVKNRPGTPDTALSAVEMRDLYEAYFLQDVRRLETLLGCDFQSVWGRYGG